MIINLFLRHIDFFYTFCKVQNRDMDDFCYDVSGKNHIFDEL